MGLADGPTEVHKVTVARQVLREYEASKDLFPEYHLPRRYNAAVEQYGDLLERELAAW
jgi:acyl-CoA dehydrogenase